MDLILAVGAIAIGLVGLFFGADFLVKGAARLAATFGIPPLVIGLTVVAYGTSMPEQIVSLTAALSGNSDIAIGNVVGSNIFNILFILGVTAFIFPVAVNSQLVKREIPLMIVVSIICYVLAVTGEEFSRIEGIGLFIGILTFTIGSYWLSQRSKPEDIHGEKGVDEIGEILSAETKPLLEAGRALLGVVILMIAAQLLVNGSTTIAKEIGISDVVIGLTLVAAGTSLPELATSVVAALRKQPDISIGNIVGSNIFNILSILGLTSIIQPIGVNEDVLRYDIFVMIAVALLLFPAAFNLKISRREGAFFLILYSAYTLFLFVR
jgi:cation:H+ antiporter